MLYNVLIVICIYMCIGALVGAVVIKNIDKMRENPEVLYFIFGDKYYVMSNWDSFEKVMNIMENISTWLWPVVVVLCIYGYVTYLKRNR